ncbi:E3 ubiquitin-protein ligase KEG [Cocos nucifera]|uniref:E3 ubiquitin-protein ligase KEG n=1 Tax=Cocos nucifera TaxID=13894 RepID=A0A8K0IR02_COCNU|nr:E3 ubiquitin-protein ligase KEG [Cocos nucifera]
MAGKIAASQATESFEFMLFDGDPDHLRAIVSNPNQISPWIDPSALKLTHRIGRGPFGDVWVATHHHCTKDYDRFHEVAVKMLYPIKDDQLQPFLVKFDEIFSKCHGLQGVCFLHGILVQNGRVCIAMKFYEGSIGDKMAHLKGGRLALSDVLRYGVDLAQGILELHSRRILILNIKPCNFLLDEHDHAVLGDFGILSLLLGLSLQNSDLVQRLGTPNYMAPEQWQPKVRGPLSFETDSWGFGCSILEMLSGIQPWHGKSPDEIYHLVVIKKEKPDIPSGLPPQVENVLYGCFEYDLRNRPLISDILHAFQSCKDAFSSDSSWVDSEKHVADRSSRIGYTDWSLLKDHLQVGDAVCSRKSINSLRSESMEILEGTVVGMEDSVDHDSFVLVRVHGFRDPFRVRSSEVKRVTYGFAAGDWVRLKEEDKKQSAVGILHSIERDGTVTVGFVGMETLWKGKYLEIQLAETYCVGQFLRPKDTVSSPRFEWPRKRGGEWATGRISQVLPNGCLVIKFPGRLCFGEVCSFLADPSEVDMVSFGTCEGIVSKYQHLEDFHWAVRPLVIALGLFTALKLGFFVGKSMGRSRQGEGPQQGGQNGSDAAWLPPSVANILFKESGAPA